MEKTDTHHHCFRIARRTADKGLVVANHVEEVKSWRLTFAATLINASRNLVFLISGGAKAELLKAFLNGPRHAETLPAQLIRPSSSYGELTWIVDTTAAPSIQETANAPIEIRVWK